MNLDITDQKTSDFVKNIGIPSVVLGALMFGIWQASTWTANEVLKPLVAQQIDFMRYVAEASKRNSETLEQIGTAVDQLRQTGLRQEKILERFTPDGTEQAQ
jgi:hypothetical protein